MSAPATRRIIVGAVSAVVVTVVIIGFVQIDSPGVARMRRFDDRRIEDLQALQLTIEWYWNEHDSLPQSLEAALSQRKITSGLADPMSDKPYEYTVLDSNTYEICAEFQLATSEPNYGAPGFWYHGAGRECFKRKAERREAIR